MEDQIVSLETAKLAKEKGFDWEVRHYYDFDNEVNEFRYYQFDRSYSSYTGYPIEVVYMAPTQTQLQRWLREIHKIEVELRANDITYEYTIWKRGYNDDEIVYFDGNTSYEETLEIALQRALLYIN